jgi:citrate lyase subunit beta/citryl-CoA lyase
VTPAALGEAVRTAATLLFVPADRPERFPRAAATSADLVILDLEDAVAPENKEAARVNAAKWAATQPCAVRINAADTQWYAADVAAMAATGAIVMVPKAQDQARLGAIAAALGPDAAIIALIETSRGVLDAAKLAAIPGVARLALGSFDLAADLDVDPVDREALLPTRGALVLASAAAGLPGPVDGVTAALDDPAVISDETAYARRLGFAGKLCIHPKQLAPVAAALRPCDNEISWARMIVESAADGVAAVDGKMVDKPVIDRAHRILTRTGTDT